MPAIAAENAITIHNLLAAFEGESNAHAKYTAFAAKAGEDGLHGAASLFRAAARSEQVAAHSKPRRKPQRVVRSSNPAASRPRLRGWGA